jgi:hypothetical protein
VRRCIVLGVKGNVIKIDDMDVFGDTLVQDLKP